MVLVHVQREKVFFLKKAHVKYESPKSTSSDSKLKTDVIVFEKYVKLQGQDH